MAEREKEDRSVKGTITTCSTEFELSSKASAGHEPRNCCAKSARFHINPLQTPKARRRLDGGLALEIIIKIYV